MRKKFHALKKIRIRQSWNKYNLYNLSRQRPQNVNRTFFQQKWAAKSLTRAYHGEQIREKPWQRMFRPHMPSVVPMDHVYLAKNDGSEQAAGRGSGADKDPSDKSRMKRINRTPYTNMVYAPIERRLDTAIFRALFASSTRQARQFVVHGSVRVNGKKMIYPGYLLNPGDMFQVEPERVLFATGAGKNKDERRAGRVMAKKAISIKSDDVDETNRTATATATEEGSDGSANPPSAPPEDPKKTLKSLLVQARTILSNPSDNLSAKRKQDLRAFQQTVKRTLSRSSSSTPTTITDSLDAELQELTSKLTLADQNTTQQQEQSKNEDFSYADKEALQAALREVRENPVDSTKPYATPWRPRDYMSAFAFIPRFLEVNQNICSAVYLRHPVARPGQGEVPTPFATETNQLAFTWYLRRR
ncbi:MAG: hypothetical protein M1812_004049 [Candelaria pacifica]|nr:MAG: hypothetical protein M1812_004049 [Candelaria pacifica]